MAARAAQRAGRVYGRRPDQLRRTFIPCPGDCEFALRFGNEEYFALALFGLTIIASVGGKSLIKGLLMGMAGLLLACVGIDMDGVARFTFGDNHLASGHQYDPRADRIVCDHGGDEQGQGHP